MKTLTTNDLHSPEKITLAEEDAGEYSLGSYSLSSGEEDSFPIATAMAAYPVVVPSATASGNSSPQPAGAGAYSYVWTKGVGRRNGKFYGYYDANKKDPYEGGVDCNMCWAGAASNSLAWWQKRYKVYNRIGTKVPTTAQGIFNRIRVYWKNNGSHMYYATDWWLSGECQRYWFDKSEYIKTKYQYKTTGGYYKSLYTASDAESLCNWYQLQGRSATQVASDFSSAYNRGAVVSITITHHKDYTRRHALSLWGFRRNSSGVINAIYMTDSNDGKYGKRINTVKVSYDKNRKLYRFKSGSYKYWYLDEYQVLEPFNRQNYSTPGSAKVNKKTNYVTFRWKNRSRGSSITHQVVYRKKGRGAYTWLSTTKNALKVQLFSDGKYEWRVRTMVDGSFTSDWVKSQFTYTGTPPKVSFYTPKKVACGKYKTKVGLRWKSNEKATFVLYLDGKRVFKGTGKSVSRRYFTVKNGVHQYTLVARDKYGNKSYTRDALYCGVSEPVINNNTINTNTTNTNNTNNTNRDTTAPSAPSSLQAKLTHSSASYSCTLSWAGVTDPSGVTYEIKITWYTSANQTETATYKTRNTYYTLSYTRDYTTRYWSVRAIDGAGNASSRTNGGSFSRYGASSAAALAPAASASALSLDKELALSADALSLAGDATLAANAGSDAAGCTLTDSTDTLLRKQTGTLAAAV